MKNLTRILLFAGIIICLLQVLLPAYFLTGDGPSHVYNSKILSELWANKNTAFYGQYFSINKAPNPNWFTHTLLALLQYITSGPWAEKLLLTAYVIFFISGFYLLLGRLNNYKSLWPVIAVVFVFNNLLATGFYNFSFSLAVLCWLVLSWLSYLEKRTIRNIIVYFLFTFLAFFTHPLAFVFGCMISFFLLLSYLLSGSLTEEAQSKLPVFIKNCGLLALIQLPFILLTAWFANKQAGEIKLHRVTYRLYDLLYFNYLVNITHEEVYFAIAVAIIFITLFCVYIVLKYWERLPVHKYDGLLACLIIALFIYVYFPDSLFGGGSIAARMQLLVFILITCCIAYFPIPGRVFNICATGVYICFVGMSAFRLPYLLSASKGVADYNSVLGYVKPYSVILPQSFSHNGINENGRKISDQNWIFQHAAEYLGTQKPLLILYNYEANTDYFPLIWKPAVNPYLHLNKAEGIVDRPSCADIEGYLKETNVAIDYVVTWCYADSLLSHEHVKQLIEELNTHYSLIYTSPTQRTRLYERKKL